MKRRTILLTTLAWFTVFSLFSFCTKDVTASDTDFDLSGTSWKTTIPYGGEEKGNGLAVIQARFLANGNGNYSWSSSLGEYQSSGSTNFTYSIKGIHGAIHSSIDWCSNASPNRIGWAIPNEAVVVLIDENTIGIGGRVFTRQ